MVRVVKTAALRQDEILDAAQRLFLQRGYAATPIQSIIDAVGIAKGTFYHHYPSKPALLDALVARMTDHALDLVHPVVADTSLDAIDRLNTIFLRIGTWKADRRELLVVMHRAMHAEANALLAARVQRESIDRLAPLLTAVIEAGVAEGVFDTAFPADAARVVLELGVGVGRALGDALLADGAPAPMRADLGHALDAYHDAVRRILGAPPGRLRLIDAEQVLAWFNPSAPPRSA